MNKHFVNYIKNLKLKLTDAETNELTLSEIGSKTTKVLLKFKLK